MFELAIYSWKRCKRLVLNKENKGKEQICLSEGQNIKSMKMLFWS